MRIFVIHRSSDKRSAKSLLKKCEKQMGAKFSTVFLNSNNCVSWKGDAKQEILRSEVVVVFNRDACEKSDNAKWEIEIASDAKKPIIDLKADESLRSICSRLTPLYDMKAEFEECFDSNLNKEQALELYKIMLDSSESLIQRRQKTSAFFITVIGSLLAIAGLMVESGAVNSGTIWLLYGFSATGLLLCNSWRNLIGNYGNLNKAKYDVIFRLEAEFGARIYAAEWVSLGKGMRPHKYRSFTTTEQNVPTYFALLVFGLTLVAVGWHIRG